MTRNQGVRQLRRTPVLLNQAQPVSNRVERRWYRIQNSAGAPTEVSIFDEIGILGVTAQDFLGDLGQTRGPINLRLNSGGGEVFEGIAIYNALRSRGGVEVTIDGLAASIASVIAMAADPGKLNIAERASMMIHDGFAQSVGNAAEMRKMAQLLDQQSENIAAIYADRTGIPAATWREAMQEESWYVGQQAVDAGLADAVVSGGSKYPVMAASDPTRLAARTVVVVNADGGHAPMTGSHSHAHPAFGDSDSHQHAHDGDASHQQGSSGGSSDMSDLARVQRLIDQGQLTISNGVIVLRNADGGKSGDQPAGNGWVHRGGKCVFDPDGDGDNDATPAGDTDHDYFAPDGTQKKAIPPCPDHPGTGKPMPSGAGAQDSAGRALTYEVRADGFAVDNSAWDASKAWHAGANSDNPGEFYKAICAGRRAGDPAKQSSWALPYKYSPTSAVNAAGVKAALGRLSSTEGLTNAPEARSKLQGLMKKINPEYEPTDLDMSMLQALFVSNLEGSNQ